MKKILVGIVIGIVLTLLLGAILSYIDPGTLIEQPKKFGDIKIWVEKTLEESREGRPQDVSEMLYISKSGKPFLSIRKGRSEDVVSMSLLNRQRRVRFTMRASEETGFWERGIYGGYNDKGKESGEMYVDIDLDGHFDLKKVFDSNNKIKRRYIYLDGEWLEVDKGTPAEAKRGITTYSFNENEGTWRKND